jgi:hypothetical protein
MTPPVKVAQHADRSEALTGLPRISTSGLTVFLAPAVLTISSRADSVRIMIRTPAARLRHLLAAPELFQCMERNIQKTIASESLAPYNAHRFSDR